MARSVQVKKLFVTALLAALVAGCARPSSLPTDPDPAQPGEEMALIGVVEGSLDELSLNDTVLNLLDAEIILDEEPADAQDVLPGAVLEGVAEKKNGRFKVRRLALKSQLLGPVEAVEFQGEAGILDVLGVQVMLDEHTYLFERGEGGVVPLTPADLSPSDYVRVYGIPQAGDGIEATLIVRTNKREHVWLRVAVRALDEGMQTFKYGLLTHKVDYSSAAVQGELSEGLAVTVKGDLQNGSIVAKQVRTKVKKDDEKPVRPAAPMHLSGEVTALDTSAQTFQVLGLEVDYSGARVQGELAEGAWIKLQGTAQNEVVKAEHIIVKQRTKRPK